MSSRAACAALAACALVALAASCDPWAILPTRADPDYCDEKVACLNPARPACDLVAHACVAATVEPPPADMTVPAQDDLAVECSGASECPVDRPICDGNRCRACAGDKDDATCRARSASAPRCGPKGACVPCRPDTQAADCPAATPICDADKGCRGCLAHPECVSGVCDDKGACIAAGASIWVDNHGMTPGACRSMGVHDGRSRATAYCDVPDALLAPGRPMYVAVAGSNQPYAPAALAAGSVFLAGPGADALPPARLAATSGAVVKATGTNTSITVDGFDLWGGDNVAYSTSNDARATVVIRRSRVHGAKRSGAFADIGGEIVVEQSEIYGNGGSGAEGKAAILTVRASELHENGLLGIDAQDAFIVDHSAPTKLAIDASRVHRNYKGGIYCARSECSVTNSFVYSNGNLDPDPPYPGPGVNFVAPTVVYFALNTVANNAVWGRAAGIACTMGVRIAYSIVWGNTASSGSQIAGTCALDGVVTGVADVFGIRKDPAFVDAKAGDYHLVPDAAANVGAGGCCVDKADVAGDGKLHPDVLHDVDRQARPKGPLADYGADEAQ